MAGYEAQVPVQEQPATEGNALSDLTRWPSSHLLGAEDLDAQHPVPAEPGMARSRSMCLREVEEMMDKLGGDLVKAAKNYESYGLQQQEGTWSYRDWIPGATGVYLVGEFNSWDTRATPLNKESEDSDVWACKIEGEQARNLQKGQKYKVYIEKENQKPLWSMPAWATRMVFTPDINQYDAIAWPISKAKATSVDKERKTKAASVPAPTASGDGAYESIYECHLGLATRQGHAKSFNEAAEVVIPRAKKLGYTALLVIGVQECKSYADMGSKPSGYFAPSSALGTPDELQNFVIKAHEAGLRVYMSPGHEGSAWSDDSLADWYFSPTPNPISGARTFDFKKPEVVNFLVSNLAYWMTEYGFDGFRFDTVGSLIYTNHGRWLPKSLEELDEVVKNPSNVNADGIHYVILANSVVHSLNPEATTIADEPSLYPGMCDSVESGGLGFDLRYNQASGGFHGLLQKNDEHWTMDELMGNLTAGGRPGERVLQCSQSARDYVVSKKPLKIAMLSWETLHTIAVGGVAPHVTELAAALNGAGHEVHIFTRAQGNSFSHEILGVHYHEVCYDRAGCLVQDANNMCSAFVHALNGHESVWGAFDIVHGHDWLAGPGVMQLKGQGKKVVFTMHSTEGGRNGDMGKGHPGIKNIERQACGAADKLICVSGVLKDEVCGVCGANGGNIDVIYNGINAQPIADMPWEDEWSGNAKEDKGFNRMDPTFLFVGRHTPQKGCDLFMEAIPNILQCRGDAKFIIVGDGHMLAHNQGRCAAMGVGHAVRFTGSLKSGSDHLKALFKACDAVVVPSRNEPFGIVVLECWAAGKPVVATTSGGPRDFVKPGEDGFLIDPEPGSIAWGCCKILENMEHAKWMGLNAQAKALREFSWENIAKQTEQVYYSLLGLDGAPRGLDSNAGKPLAQVLMKESCMEMMVQHRNPAVVRGISLLKIWKLLAAAVGNSVMTWMGSEFGQIDVVDMPRPGNGFNDECSRIKYELADNTDLKFSQMAAFEAALNRAAQECQWGSEKCHQMVLQSEEDKVLVFTRGKSLFVLNLHPHSNYENYGVQLPKGLAETLQTTPALATEDERFGGFSGVSTCSVEPGKNSLLLTLPPRSGFVFRCETSKIEQIAGA